MKYPLEGYEEHQNCPLGMDVFSAQGWWCELHNVDITEPEDVD